MQSSGAQQQHHAPPTRLRGQRNPALLFLPDNPENHNRDDEAVAHILVVRPLAEHPVQNRKVADDQHNGGDRYNNSSHQLVLRTSIAARFNPCVIL